MRFGWRERDMDEEMHLHIDLEAQELMRSGMPEAEARRRALLAFGGIEQQKERARDQRRGKLLDEVAGDARFALRWLRRAPGFTAAAVLTLAIGIGSATVILGAADHILIRPLPYSDPERVVTLWERDRMRQESFEFSPGNFLSLRERAQSYAVIALAEPTGFDLYERGSAEALSAWAVTDGFITALGVSPALGRPFRADDYLPGTQPVLLISHDLWQRKFGADPQILGRALRVDDIVATVIGVLPTDLPFPDARDVWAPKRIREDERQDRSGRYDLVIGRLRDRIDASAAQAEADAIAATLAREFPRTNSHTDIEIRPLEAHVLGRVRPAMLVVAAAVTCLLLIACANLANLLLARGLDRERELAVRAALGAGRARIARQLLTESVLLCVLGGIAGLLLAVVGIAVLKSVSPPNLPRIASLELDPRVLIISAALTCTTACVISIAPVLRLSRPGLSSDLRGAGRVLGGGRAGVAMRGALVVTEIALAIVLLTGAVLFARSFAHLLDNDLGFEPGRRLTVQTFLWDRNPTQDQRVARVKAIEAELRGMPGVEAVGATTVMPFHPHQIASQRELSIAGLPSPREEQRVTMHVVTPGLFNALGMRLVDGRGFTDHDRDGGQLVIVINQRLAQHYFPGEKPIGRRVAVRSPGSDDLVLREIVGVVYDVRAIALDGAAPPAVYLPHAQNGSGSMTFIVSAAPGARLTLADLSAAVWRVDPGQAIYHAVAAETLISETVAERRFQLLLLGTFSTIGLLLALIGIYGLIAFVVRARMKEFGLRLALGATPRDVIVRVLRDALRLNVRGVIIGMAAAIMLTRFVQHMLYEVDPADPATLLQVAVITLACGTAAALVPALRAASTAPLVVLRED